MTVQRVSNMTNLALAFDRQLRIIKIKIYNVDGRRDILIVGGRDEHGRADGKVEQLQVQGSCSGSSSAPRFSAAPTYAMGGNLGNTQNVTSHCHASIYHIP